MPAQASNQTSIRAPGHRSHLYFAYFTPDVILQATVQTDAPDGTTNLSISITSGSENDVRRGYLVRVETSGGVLKGITNVRQGGTISATALPIHELGGADIDINSGDVIKVYNIPYLADKLPTSDSTFAPDGVGSGSQGTNFAPNCRSGGHFIGLVDGYGTASPSTYATVTTAGSLSELLDPDSSTPGTHFWSLLTDTLTFAPGSSSSDANPVIRAEVGYGILQHNFDDADATQSWSQFVCFQVYDATTMPRRLIEATLNADEATGWAAEVELFTNTTIDALPDGSMVGLFAHEWMGGSIQSFGSAISGRSHIKLIGFLHRDENEVTPQNKRVRLSIQSPLQRLSNLPGFSKIFTRTASDWTQIEDLTVLLGIVHLLHYYSFFTEMFDVIIDAAFLDKLYSAFYINEQVALEQARELADGVDARITNLRTGELCLHTQPCLIPEGDRSGVTTTYTIGKRDLQRMNFVRDHWKVVKLLETRGFIAGASDNTPVFSRYPGNTPGRGAQTIAVERIIADDQSDSNTRCGRRGGKADGTYINSDGEYMRAVEWSPVLFGSHDFFDFNKEYVATDLGATSNLRGIDLSAMRYYLTRITVRYHDGTADVEPVFATATNAPPGATYIPSDISLPDYTVPDYTPQPLPAPSSTSRIPIWNGVDQLPTKVFLLDRGGAHASIATAWSPSLSSLTYTDISTGLSGIGVWACSDPYDYRRRFALTADGLYRCDNIWSFSTWTQVADNATLYGDAARIGTFIGMSINRKGYIYITSGTNAFIYTTDYGATWNRVSVDGGALSYYTSLPSGNEAHLVALVSSHNSGASGVLYATTGTMYFGVGNTFRLRKSTDWGATWTAIADRDDFGFPTNFTNPCNLHIPHTRSDGTPNVNDSSQELYLLQDTGTSCVVSRSTNAGLSGTAYGHGGGATSHTGWQMMSFTHDGAKIAFAGKAHGLNTNPGIIISDDSAATEIRHSHLYAQGGNYICLNGFSNHSQAWLLWCQASGNSGDAKIIWTVDDGANYQSVATPSTFTGTIKLPAYVEWDLSDFIAPA